MLKGKTALVTGSTSGIGLGIARALGAAGANIMLNGFGDAAQIEALRAGLAKEFGVKVGYSGADISKPQEVSRQFKLNKNLTWKIAKVLQTNDALEAVPLIPGSEGMEILLAAMSGAGASAASVQAVRTKLAAFEHMVEAHVGDRATLELLMEQQAEFL